MQAIHPSPLVEQAADTLRKEIAEGRWPVGGRLPAETALAERLNVGRSTVREALRLLAGLGLVRAKQGAGVFVLADRPQEGWPEKLRRAALVDVYEARMLVEVQAGGLAAARRTEEDVRAMRAALTERRAAAERGGEEFVARDIALHNAVVAAAHNPVLTDLFAELAPVLRRGLSDLLALTDIATADPGRGDAALSALVEAVDAGDAEAADRALRAELTRTLDRLRDTHGTGTAAGTSTGTHAGTGTGTGEATGQA